MLTHEQATEETDEVLDDEGPEGLVEDAQVGGGGAGLRQRRGGGASAGAAYVCWHVGTRVTVSWLADEGTVGMRTGGQGDSEKVAYAVAVVCCCWPRFKKLVTKAGMMGEVGGLSGRSRRANSLAEISSGV